MSHEHAIDDLEIIELDSIEFEELFSRPHEIGSHYKYSAAKESTSLAIDSADSRPYVDTKAMSARAIISTATVDRVGDSLDPRGCDLTNYAKNPVVLWGHGLEGISIPIATSMDPRGNLAITITDKDVIATSFFSPKNVESSQIFQLIDEGIVRATSVRETPKKAKQYRDRETGKAVTHVSEWELEEWSWCAIGVNPDSVAKCLHRGKLAGRPIGHSILKSLNAVMPPKRTYGVGFDSEVKGDNMAYEDDDDDKDPSETVADDVDNAQSGGSRKPVDPSTLPYGQQALKAVHSGLTGVKKCIMKCMGPLEHAKVKQGLSDVHDVVKDQLSAIEGMHCKHYPKGEQLKSDEPEEDGENDESDGTDDSEMKSFLALNESSNWQIAGIESRLKSIAFREAMSSASRSMLLECADQLSRLHSQAKSWRPQTDEDKAAKLARDIERAKRELFS